jgi:[ribosomal protein S5]-alanine N-acetyltransferase
LTEIRKEDLTSFVKSFNNIQIHQYLRSSLFPYTEKMFNDWYECIKKQENKTKEIGHFAIRDNNELIGVIEVGGLRTDTQRPIYEVEIAFWLSQNYWGKGIMSLTVKTLCQYIHVKYNIVRISALILTNNQASCRVLEKCNFVKEGVLRKKIVKDGKYFDGFLYALIF